MNATRELQYAIEQWYYREARLLDDRQYRKWLELCALEIRYVVPGRGNPLVDNRMRGKEAMLSVDGELEGVDSDGLPIRNENHACLSLRVERSFKANAWAENPPARTRRIVGNVEVADVAGDRLSVLSNFHLHYARPGTRSYLYAGQRRIITVGAGEDFKIARREVVLDMATIDFPTVGLFF
jgi:3-phenylpropionate/cinnamic acid dioxygenase small subunit